MRAWVLQRYQVYARVFLLSAILIVPAIFNRATIDVFNLVKITALWILGVLALASWISWAAERRRWVPRFHIMVAAGVFLAACALSTIFSQNPAISLLGLYHRYGGLVPFALYAGVMVLIVGLYWERPGDLKEVARASAAASLIMAAYVLIQAAGLDWIKWQGTVFPVGTMGNSNFAGGYLGIGVPFLIYVARSARRAVWQLVLTVLVGLDLLALWFTQTRGGMVAAAAGLATLGFFFWRSFARWIKVVIAAAAVTAAILAGLIVAGRGVRAPTSKPPPLTTLDAGSLKIRIYYWRTALRIFADHPIVGTGPDTYYANYPRYRLPADGAQLGFSITDKPHNIYLEYASNTGVLGAGSYVAMVGLAGWYGLKRRKALAGADRLLLASFVATLAGYLAQGFFSIDVPPLAMMGWVAMGGIAAIADPAVVSAQAKLAEEEAKVKGKPGRKKKTQPARAPQETIDRGRARWGIHVPVALAAAVLVVEGMHPVLADTQAKTGQVHEVQKDSNLSISSSYNSAISWYPLEPSYRSLAAAQDEQLANSSRPPEERRRLYEEALGRYRQALRLQPGNIFLVMNIARLYSLWGQGLDQGKYKDADRWWTAASKLDPTDWEVHKAYAVMLNAWSNSSGGDAAIRRRSAAELERVVAIRPQETGEWINLGKLYKALGDTSKARSALLGALKAEPGNKDASDLLASLAAA